MGITEVTKSTFDEEILGAKVPVMIMFYREGDEACKELEIVVEEVAQELQDEAKVCKVNVDNEIFLAMNYQVIDLPLLVFMNFGIYQERIAGAPDKDKILQVLHKLIDLKGIQNITF